MTPREINRVRRCPLDSDPCPPDVITEAEVRVPADQFHPPQGIPFENLNQRQQAMLLELVAHFAQKYREPIVCQIRERTPISDGKDMFFAWAGGFEPGEGHCYRVQPVAFLFEYDNTQDNANQIDTV